ncbi:MAG: hypothetical protein A2Z16_05070 [Chloroflexi bacterium RBG_16_54_18]|nr:MAG: hypothetical protein A2Z16_05070 [Chloroflexi bacterium RBG_16_54_18]
MKPKLLQLIHCPTCHSKDFEFITINENQQEIREGFVICRNCQNMYEINNGILNLLISPTPEIISEQQGWTQLEKAVQNTDELMLSLPDAVGENQSYWQSQAENFHYMWDQLALDGNEVVLDLGSGRCWSTRFFARAGCYAVGIDILQTKYVGLLTSDIYINNEGVFFERLCGNMNELPFRSESFDVIFIAATLHHSSSIVTTLKQVEMLLKPGGYIVLINEPVARIMSNKKISCPEIDHGINEHVYWFAEYLYSFRKVGLKVKLYPFIGSYHPIISGINHSLVKRFPQKLMKRRIWPPLLPLQLILAGGILNLIAHKPSFSEKNLQ